MQFSSFMYSLSVILNSNQLTFNFTIFMVQLNDSYCEVILDYYMFILQNIAHISEYSKGKLVLVFAG